MKKLLIILLLSISLNLQAQMKITNHIKDTMPSGKLVTYRYYEAKIPSPYTLIFLHGAGEKGPLDGSNLKIFDAKHGYVKLAKGIRPGSTTVTGVFDFPFNIVAPQTSESDFFSLSGEFPKYIKDKTGSKVIIVTGLSMGGFGAYFMQYLNPDDVYAIASVCGSQTKFKAATWPEIRASHYHGDKDGTVSLSSAVNFINAYNATHTSQIEITVYPGVAHNAWDKAYSVTPGQDKLLQQIYKWFYEAYPPVPPTDWEAEYKKLKEKIDSAVLILTN